MSRLSYHDMPAALAGEYRQKIRTTRRAADRARQAYIRVWVDSIGNDEADLDEVARLEAIADAARDAYLAVVHELIRLQSDCHQCAFYRRIGGYALEIDRLQRPDRWAAYDAHAQEA